MLDLIITGLIAAPAIRLASEIATWCFKEGADRERLAQRMIKDDTWAIIRDERIRQRRLKREMRAQLWEEKQAARALHHKLLNDLWGAVHNFRSEATLVLCEFDRLHSHNCALLREHTLTPEQRTAIQECNDHLERGRNRIKAYKGPYLSLFLASIHNAQIRQRDGEFVTPELPSPILPEDFPFVGEVMIFEAEELDSFPHVDLGYNQPGLFITKAPLARSEGGSLRGFIKHYDFGRKLWILSAAYGDLAGDIAIGLALYKKRNMFLGDFDRTREHRKGWWKHPSGEIVSVHFEVGALSPRMRAAPFGTSIEAFIHGADFFLRTIEAGERPVRDVQNGLWTIPTRAPTEFWEAYKVSVAFSNKCLIRERGMTGDPSTAEFVLRIASGQEFPMVFNKTEGIVVLGDRCGARLGFVSEGTRKFGVFVFRGEFSSYQEPYGVEPEQRGAVRGLKYEITQCFEEQSQLERLENEDLLELEKYLAVLRTASKWKKRKGAEHVEFQKWEFVGERQARPTVIRFLGGKKLTAGLAVLLQEEEDSIGWSQEGSEKDGTEVQILSKERARFLRNEVIQQGALHGVPVDSELKRHIEAVEQFRSAAAADTLTGAEKIAFSSIRRELLGQFDHLSLGTNRAVWEEVAVGLDAAQREAVNLLSGSDHLVLIQGPPGTGKTHVIARGIGQILASNPQARIAITSQANPAVDEAIAKLQDAFPDLQVYRDYSRSAKERYASLDRGVGLDHYFGGFLRSLTDAQPHAKSSVTFLRNWLRSIVQRDPDRIRWDFQRILGNRSQIVGCTLSRLSVISRSAQLFDLVIVDEAAKASVPETLIAASCAKRLALVGDHKQLLPYLDESFYEHSAPTKNDQALLRDLWDNSLFARLWAKAPDSRKVFLNVMRRSREPIARCISDCFYEGRLQPSRGHDSSSIELPLSLVWIDSKQTQHEETPDKNICNPGEAQLVFESLGRVLEVSKSDISIAIIAFHRGQLDYLSAMVKKVSYASVPAVLTVDSSQGGQWDIVILSLARTKGSSRFVGNPNRLNVALSRAKELCVIVGSTDFARKDGGGDSYLSAVLRFVESVPKRGKWIWVPRGEMGIPTMFGLRAGAKKK